MVCKVEAQSAEQPVVSQVLGLAVRVLIGNNGRQQADTHCNQIHCC